MFSRNPQLVRISVISSKKSYLSYIPTHFYSSSTFSISDIAYLISTLSCCGLIPQLSNNSLSRNLVLFQSLADGTVIKSLHSFPDCFKQLLFIIRNYVFLHFLQYLIQPVNIHILGSASHIIAHLA